MSRRRRFAVAVVLALGAFGLLAPAVVAGPSASVKLRIGTPTPARIAQPEARRGPQSTHDLCALHRDLP